jgi:hypothetical protein
MLVLEHSVEFLRAGVGMGVAKLIEDGVALAELFGRRFHVTPPK